MNNKNRSEISTSLFWKILENGGSQGVQFIVSVLLARLLSPSEYGTVAIVLIFTTIANVLVQNGFASALIQKFHADDLDFSSVLIFNVLLSVAIYILLFLSFFNLAAITCNYLYNMWLALITYVPLAICCRWGVAVWVIWVM